MIKAYGICQVSIAPLRAEKSDTSEIVTQLLFGDYVEIREIGEPWIKIYFPTDNYHGYMDFKQLFYIDNNEFESEAKKQHTIVSQKSIKINSPIGPQHIIRGSNLPNFDGNKIKMGTESFSLIDTFKDINETFVETALNYINTPYLWGGKGIYGIDCSGFTQIVAKIHGITLARDASKQVNIGAPIEFKDRKQGDLMYFINSKGIVHHVGIIIEENKIIHAAGHVRIDPFNEEGIFRADLNKITHFYHSIKRI